MSVSSLSMVATTAASASSSLFSNLSNLSFSHTIPTRFSVTPKFSKPLKFNTQNSNFASFSLISLSPLHCAPATSLDTEEESPDAEQDEIDEQKQEDGSFSESGEEGRLYVGNLPYSMTSAQVAEVFGEAGRVANVEIVYDRITDRSRGFAFVTMGTAEEAKEAIRMFDGSQIGGRTVKVNFPEVPRGGERKVLGPKIRESYRAFIDSPHKIYAGNLGWRVTSEALREAFASQSGLLSAKVIYERDTGRSRGFGFVSFESADNVQAALDAMNGVEVEGRPLRLNLAAEKAPSSPTASERDTKNITDSSELITSTST